MDVLWYIISFVNGKWVSNLFKSAYDFTASTLYMIWLPTLKYSVCVTILNIQCLMSTKDILGRRSGEADLGRWIKEFVLNVRKQSSKNLISENKPTIDASFTCHSALYVKDVLIPYSNEKKTTKIHYLLSRWPVY